MKPKSYWAKRSDQIAARQYRKAGAHELELRKEYDRATKAISRDVEAFYGRYADNNEVSLADAQKALTSVELQQHRMSLEEFTHKAKNNADGRWTKELNNAYYKVRVSRLEALELQIGQHIELLAGGRQISTGKLLGDAYTDTYYRTMHEVQTGLGFGSSFAKVDEKGLEKILGTKLDGRNWSQRIWDDRSKLRQEMHTVLSQGFIRGENVNKMSRSISEKMGVSYNRARALVQTETAFFAEQATMDSYKQSGVVSKYEVIVSFDERTCNVCGAMDGKVFLLSEMEVSITYPPFHTRCRCTTVPYFDDEIDPGQRIARNVDGDSYYVPGDISYNEWKEQYVDSSKPPDSAIINQKEYRKFDSVESVKEWEKLVTPQWMESLTVHEANAIATYTGSSYVDINNNLRRNLRDEHLDTLSEQISSGIKKFDLKENLTVYRGMESNIFNGRAVDLPGVEFIEPAFTSTTLLRSSSFSGDVQMEIRIPAKTKAAAINPLSKYKDLEYEVLIDKGTKYRIIEAVEEGNKLNLVAEVIE